MAISALQGLQGHRASLGASDRRVLRLILKAIRGQTVTLALLALLE